MGGDFRADGDLDSQLAGVLVGAGASAPGVSAFHPVHHHHRGVRAVVLFELAEQWELVGPHAALAKQLEVTGQSILGRPLNMNVDGAIAAVLVDLEIAPALANAFFMIARLPGLVAHATEEQSRQRPMRKIDPSAVSYDGPELRHLG